MRCRFRRARRPGRARHRLPEAWPDGAQRGPVRRRELSTRHRSARLPARALRGSKENSIMSGRTRASSIQLAAASVGILCMRSGLNLGRRETQLLLLQVIERLHPRRERRSHPAEGWWYRQARRVEEEGVPKEQVSAWAAQEARTNRWVLGSWEDIRDDHRLRPAASRTRWRATQYRCAPQCHPPCEYLLERPHLGAEERPRACPSSPLDRRAP